MKKLLHERLREIYDMPDSVQKAILLTRYGDVLPVSRRDARALADEIERYYIPRPRFEDGEPVKVGDKLYYSDDRDATVEWYTVGSDGTYDIGVDQVAQFDGFLEETLKRPFPKVLDADGVEIKVGDTVYRVEGDWFGHVIGFETDEHGEHIVICDSMKSPAKFLTHKEPDSLEKLLDDMAYDPMMHSSIYRNRLADILDKVD